MCMACLSNIEPYEVYYYLYDIRSTNKCSMKKDGYFLYHRRFCHRNAVADEKYLCCLLSTQAQSMINSKVLKRLPGKPYLSESGFPLGEIILYGFPPSLVNNRSTYYMTSVRPRHSEIPPQFASPRGHILQLLLPYLNADGCYN